MTKITLKEFDLDLDNEKKLISDLEKISFIHSLGTGRIFNSPFFRIKAQQQPYFGIKKISLSAMSKKEINYPELKEVIKNNINPTVIVYSDDRGKLIHAYYLPEAVDGNPKKRKLVWDTNPIIYEPSKPKS
jgi:hypothetical protein